MKENELRERKKQIHKRLDALEQARAGTEEEIAQLCKELAEVIFALAEYEVDGRAIFV